MLITANFYFSVYVTGCQRRLRKNEHYPRWIKGFCILFYEMGYYVFSWLPWDNCIMIGGSMALLLSLVGTVYGCEVEKG